MLSHFLLLLSILHRTIEAKPLVPADGSTSSVIAKPTLLGNPDAGPNPPAANASLLASLLTAMNTVTRFQLLGDAISNGMASSKFDYNPAANTRVVPGEGGEAVVASRSTFPMVTELGISGAAFFFAPCGLNTPHTHPRASEIFTVSTDHRFSVGYVLENGLTLEVNNTLTQYQGTIFPQGSIHWQQNLDCTPAVAIGALSSDDPGTSSIAPNFLANDAEIVQAALGYPDQVTPENFAMLKSKVPPSFVRGIEECYQRCGIKH